MPRFRPKDAPPEVSSTPFSEFIRATSSEEEKKVYSKVMKRASIFDSKSNTSATSHGKRKPERGVVRGSADTGCVDTR
jgi:hypothetical protein